jgi:hypothetical protein
MSAGSGAMTLTTFCRPVDCIEGFLCSRTISASVTVPVLCALRRLPGSCVHRDRLGQLDHGLADDL